MLACIFTRTDQTTPKIHIIILAYQYANALRIVLSTRTSLARELPHPGSHSTFISRMNDQGLAVAFHHNQPFYPITGSSTQLTQQKSAARISPRYHFKLSQVLLRTFTNLTAGIYIGAIFTIQLVSIILTILFTPCIFFVHLYRLWTPEVLHYSIFVRHHIYFWKTTLVVH